ncbi:MAG: glycosyltransferase [Anaerolineaceae bacterium]
MKKIGVVIINYNSSEYLNLSLDSLLRAKTDIPFCVGIIDNGSTKRDESKCRNIVSSLIGDNLPIQGFYIASEKNLGFSGGNNVVIKRFLDDPSISHVCLLNSDVIVTDHWIDYLLADDLDITGPVTNAAGNEQTIAIDYSVTESDSAFKIINGFAEKRHAIYQGHKNTTDTLYFFCTCIKRSVIEKIGLLDEQFYPGSFEDNDYCKRMIEAGFKLTVIRSCFIHHFGSGSFSKLDLPQRINISNVNRQRFENKWNTHWKDTSWKLALSCRLDLGFFAGKKTDLWAISLIDKSMQNIENTINDWSSMIAFYQSEQFIEHILSTHVDTTSNASSLERMQITSNPNTYISFESVSGRKLLKIALKKAIKKFLRMIHLLEFCESKIWKKKFDVNKLVKIVHRYNVAHKKVICVFAPMFTKKNERDGYFQRVKFIDKNIFADCFRIYLNDDGSLSNKIKIHFVDKEKIYLIFNSHDQVQREQIFTLIKHCGIFYTHSILRFIPDSSDVAMQKLFELDGVKKIWDVHGAVPEEYLLDGNNNHELANEAEKFFFNHTDIMIVVNNAMKEHFEKKYGSYKAKVVILPILKEDAIKISNCIDNKKLLHSQRPTVVYSGGLQKWQNIDLMQDVIEQTMDFINFKILVPDTLSFKKMWGNRQKMKNIILDSKSPNKMEEEYRLCHYGLVLRDDITVNNVACPTKIIEYIIYGIVPIFKTSSIGDFSRLGIQYINYKELIAGNLPSEDERIKMVENNKNILKHLVQESEDGISKLLTAINKYNTREVKVLISSKSKENDKPVIGLVVGSFDKGGLEQAVFNLYEGYRKLGYECYVLCQSDNIGHFAKKLYSSEHLLIFKNNTHLFLNFCKRKNIRWLHYHYNTFLIDKVREFGIHTIYSIQNIYSWLSDDEIMERSRLINTADYIVAGSTFSKDYYCKRTNTPISKVEVIPIGVNTEDLDNTKLDNSFSRNVLGIEKNDITLGFIASFHEVKHQMNMVGVMERIIKINPKIKLIFLGNIGHTEYFSKVRESWKQSPANNNIIHIPFIDHSQIGEFLRKTVDIFILPSIQEGCSNAVIDALYCGKPMLLTDVGNASDLKHLESVTVVRKAFKNLYTFRQSDISKLSLKKNCINTTEIVNGILDIADHLDERNKAAKIAALQYKEKCDKGTMVRCYVTLIEKYV